MVFLIGGGGTRSGSSSASSSLFSSKVIIGQGREREGQEMGDEGGMAVI